MLPFLKPKKLASVIIAKRTKADAPTETVREEGEALSGLVSAAEAIISAVNAKDASALASALESAMKQAPDTKHE